MDKIYTSYLNCLVEKDVSDEENSIYITCKLSKDLQEKFKALVYNLDTAEEIEDEPHCTFLWANLDKIYDKEMIFRLIRPILKDIEFDASILGFHTFEKVSEGKQDCLVVQLEAPANIIQLQQDLKILLDKNDIELTQTYPEWKPHMTIGYFKAGTDIQYDQPSNDMLAKLAPTSIDYLKVNNSKPMYFNEQ